MEYKRLGKSDVTVSAVTVGTWPMCGSWWGPADDAVSVKTLLTALDLGINTFDTAEAYNNGHSEQIIGKAIIGRKNEAVISTKVANYHMTKDAVIASCEQSLRNIGRGFIDIYFLHWPAAEFGHEDVPLEETLEAVALLKQQGKIRAFGLSNFGIDDLKKTDSYVHVDACQPPFNMLWRFSDDIVCYCLLNGISVLPYASLGQGILTGAITPDTVLPEGDKRGTTPLFERGNLRNAVPLVNAVRDLAAVYGVAPAALVVSWMRSYPGITSPLVGCRTPEEVQTLESSTGIRLRPEDFIRLNKLSEEFAGKLPRYRHFFTREIIR